MEKQLYYKIISSPVGKLKLIASDKGLSALLFATGRSNKAFEQRQLKKDDAHPILMRTEKQLVEYFAGKRSTFDVPLEGKGTVFQMKAWRELSKIPYGETISYGQQAKGLGDAKKARAVGMANGRNPISIIVPCHRVVGANGSLTGFGGGLKTKEFLLNLEKKHAA